MLPFIRTLTPSEQHSGASEIWDAQERIPTGFFEGVQRPVVAVPEAELTRHRGVF